jgi:hypothetical protein
MTSSSDQDWSTKRFATVGVFASLEPRELDSPEITLTSFVVTDNVARRATLATMVAPTAEVLLHTFDTGADLSGVPKFAEVRGNAVWTCWTPEDDPGEWSLGIEATATRVTVYGQSNLVQLVDVAPETIRGDPSGVAAEIALTRIAPPLHTDLLGSGTGGVWRTAALGQLQIASIVGAVTNAVDAIEINGGGFMWVAYGDIRAELTKWVASLFEYIDDTDPSMSIVRTALGQAITHA